MKIIATNILDLSAARYFAARLTDILIFDASLCVAEGIPQIKEIMGWVDGVQWGIETGEDPSALSFVTDETKIHFVVCEAKIHLPPHVEPILKHPPENSTVESAAILHGKMAVPPNEHGHPLYREVDAKTLQSALLDGMDGIVIQAPTEHEVGMMDYDEVETVFDWPEQESASRGLA